MRLRKQHAWGALLITLFVLPVLRPEGIRAIEDPAGGFFAWFAEALPSPRLWAAAGGEPAGESDRARALELENRQLWERQVQTQQRLREIGELKEALCRSELDRLPKAVLARVVRAHDPVPRRRSLLIDRGAADGIEMGHPVVMGAVYLGRVRVVREHSAVVQLVTDPPSRLEVFVRTSKGRLLRGYTRPDGSADGVDLLAVEFVRLQEDGGVIAPGAPVFTANADERVPAYLLLGTVREVSDPDLDRMPTLSIRPALDLDRSTEVVVLLTGEGVRSAGQGVGARAR